MILLLLAALLSGDVDAAGVRRAVRAHRGQPVVLNLWATWCEPCVHEFPDLIALARRHPEAAFLAVSIDEPGDRTKVEAFLAEKRPPFPVYLRKRGPDQPFIDGVDPGWSGVVPAILVYDKGGRRVGLLPGEHTTAQIEESLKAAAR